MTQSVKPLLVIAGEPAGVGPELLAAIACQTLPVPIVYLGDPVLLPSLCLLPYTQPLTAHVPGQLPFIPVNLSAPVQAGVLNIANVEYVLATLKKATALCLQNEFPALVTGPVHKGIINDASVPFSGQTGFIAAQCEVSDPVMMLCHQQLRIALVTTHIPLQAVAKAIQIPTLMHTITTVYKTLQQHFGISLPRIAVCGLNPHAGEQGHLGREEIEIIQPAIAMLQAQGMQLTGPIPADSAFNPAMRCQFDAWITMYHDQGLPVLKALGFGDAVNVTLGLPIIRTSVDHGTALDIAGKQQADTGSLLAAIHLAAELAARTHAT